MEKEEINLLIDTNIWLERLLNQERSLEVKQLLDNIPPKFIYISDFSLHSIGVIMGNLKKFKEYTIFVDDLFNQGRVMLVALNPDETKNVIATIEKKGLDFDDSYQYCIGEKYGLKIITFDQDFFKVNIKTYTPKEALKIFESGIKS